jgi:hypothetical protein
MHAAECLRRHPHGAEAGAGAQVAQVAQVAGGGAGRPSGPLWNSDARIGVAEQEKSVAEATR